MASVKHEFVAIRVLDPLEKAMPKSVLMDFTDLEPGDRLSLDMGSGKCEVSRHQDEKRGELKSYFGTNKIDFLELSSDSDYVEVLLRYFIQREKKR